MNIPFPIIYPRMMYPDWFNSERLYDEDAELTRMEQENKRWLNSITKKYNKYPPRPKPNPEPMEEADDDVFIVTGNDEPESEESHDVDEEEMPTTTESPPRNNDLEPETPEESPEESPDESPEESPEVSNADTADLEVAATLWPYVAQDD